MQISQLKNNHQMGIEFAFEGINPDKFKASSNKEKKEFLKGYQKGLQILKSTKHESVNNTTDKRVLI